MSTKRKKEAISKEYSLLIRKKNELTMLKQAKKSLISGIMIDAHLRVMQLWQLVKKKEHILLESSLNYFDKHSHRLGRLKISLNKPSHHLISTALLVISCLSPNTSKMQKMRPMGSIKRDRISQNRSIRKREEQLHK